MNITTHDKSKAPKEAARERKTCARWLSIEAGGLRPFTTVTTYYRNHDGLLMARRWGGKSSVTAASMRRIEALAKRHGGLQPLWVLPSVLAVSFHFADGETAE